MINGKCKKISDNPKPQRYKFLVKGSRGVSIKVQLMSKQNTFSISLLSFRGYNRSGINNNTVVEGGKHRILMFVA
jgi:hypothetical protein